MPYKGVLKKDSTCAICKKKATTGETVYHDPSKRQGSHLAHAECWEKLLEARGGAASQINKPRSQKGSERSREDLDPAF